MACSCISKKTNIQNNESGSNTGFTSIYTKNILPFQTCPMCAIKHLSYALVKLNIQNCRMIGNIYLAYKHLDNCFLDLSKSCFKLIQKYFNNQQINKSQILTLIEDIHKIIPEYEQNLFQDNQTIFNFQSNLNIKHIIYLKLLACNQLYNYEVGYTDINTPFIIGLLQQCAQLSDNDFFKNDLRIVWKNIEVNKLQQRHNLFIRLAKEILSEKR